MGWLLHFSEGLQIHERFKMLVWISSDAHLAKFSGRGWAALECGDGRLLADGWLLPCGLFLELHKDYQNWGAFRLLNPRPKVPELTGATPHGSAGLLRGLGAGAGGGLGEGAAGFAT